VTKAQLLRWFALASGVAAALIVGGLIGPGP
jgi:hypothetical protein